MTKLMWIPIIGITVLLTFLSSCEQKSDNKLSREQKKWVEKTLKSMTTEQKVGQLLAPAISPPKNDSNGVPLERVTEWLNKYHIGHVYMATSRMDPLRAAKFINDIQSKSDIPLLIHSDLECGPGDKFNGGTILPPLMGLAQTRSETLVYNAASITAKEARAIGIHLINSPVLDVNINPDNPVISIRSFGDDPALVSQFGTAYVKGLNDNGFIGAAKHFPGHGDVDVDSHTRMPTITAGRDRLNSVEFYPYKKVIPSGLMAIMTAHISIPALDPTPGLPATMSKPILTGVLRGELEFDGLVITDAFDMGGILETGSFEESAVQSVIAGNDVVLLWTVPQFEKVFPHMLKAIEDGRISQTRLNESVRRNLITKARVGLYKDKLVELEKISLTVDIPEHREMASEIWEKSIVLVKNDGNILPLEKQNKTIAVLSVNDDKNHLQIGETFINEIKTRGKVRNAFSVDPNTSVEELNKILKDTNKADLIVVGLFARIYARRDSPSLINQHLIQFLQDMSKGNAPVFVVSFGSPYLISQLPGIAGYMIATEPTWEFYGYDKFRPGQIAAAKALFGETDITGKLAVTIPDLYPFGHGITFTAGTQK